MKLSFSWLFTLIENLMKGVVLLLGFIMLAGGGICSVWVIPASFKQPEALPMLIIALPVAILGYALILWVFPDKNYTTMNLTNFLLKIQNQQPISFDETMNVIAENYNYQPTEFSNGLGEDKLISPEGTNQGSCKIFAFAQLHNLNPEQTLNLFGDYYRVEVLQNPNGTDHQNIRLFIKYGWEGITFQSQVLTNQ